VKQRLVSDQSDHGFSNRAQLLNQLRGRGADFSDITFAQALGRAANNAQRPLFMKPEPVAESFGRHSNKVFADQGNLSLTVDGEQKFDEKAEFSNGRRNHAHNPKLQPEPVKPQGDDARWHSMANQLQGHTHSQTAQIRQIVGCDGRETYELRVKALKKLEGR
jgi:hypothetical protein